MSVMNKVRVGMIGCGGIAVGKHLPALANSQVDIVGFYNMVEERGAQAKADFGSSDAKIYDDYRRLLEDPSIDVVHVCTPNDTHAEISIAALEAGKHVMCEKPMAKTAEEARRMVEAAKSTGRKLTIGYQNRFRDDSLYLKSSVIRRLGRDLLCESARAAPPRRTDLGRLPR